MGIILHTMGEKDFLILIFDLFDNYEDGNDNNTYLIVIVMKYYFETSRNHGNLVLDLR